jgi:hypothetical protein
MTRIPQPSPPEPSAKPEIQAKPGLPRNALVSAVVLLALIPLGILFVQLWQDMVRPHGADALAPAGPRAASISNATVSIAVAPPSTGEERLGRVAGNGAVSEQSKTRAGIAPLPPAVATVDDPLSPDFAPSEEITTAAAVESTPSEVVAQAEATESTPSEAIAQSEATGSIAAEAPPLPQQKPEVKVHTVKTVAIAPPRQTKPYGGGYGLGPATEAPQAPAEWMETKTAVDMHAKAEQSSETVKVAQGGIKVRVTARDKNWVQVTDPKTSTTGWIYNRFLTPTEPPAQ